MVGGEKKTKQQNNRKKQKNPQKFNLLVMLKNFNVD